MFNNPTISFPVSFLQCLDASRMWLVYWCVHGLDLLGYTLSDEEAAA